MKTVFQLLACLFFIANAYSIHAQNLEQRVTQLEQKVKNLPAGPRGDRGPQGSPGEPRDLKCLDIYSEYIEIEYSGRAYANLGRNKSGKGFLALFQDSKKDFSAFLGGNSEGTGGMLVLYNNSGEPIVILGSSKKSVGILEINGERVKDLAESFEIAERGGVIPGTVMTMKADGAGTQPAKEAYDRKVVGVVSEAGGLSPGMVLGSRADGSNDLPVAIAGQVYVRVNLEGGDIAVGDLLVSSGKPGVAMKASDPMKAFSATVGKALAPFTEKDLKEKGEGLLLMLVMNH